MRYPNCNHFYLFDNKYICPKCGEILDYQFKKDVEYFANKYGEVSYQFFDLADIKDLWNWFNENGNKINILKFDIDKWERPEYSNKPFYFNKVIIIYIKQPGQYFYRAFFRRSGTSHFYQDTENEINNYINNFLRNSVWNKTFTRTYNKWMPLDLNIYPFWQQNNYSTIGFSIAAFRR